MVFFRRSKITHSVVVLLIIALMVNFPSVPIANAGTAGTTQLEQEFLPGWQLMSDFLIN